jgi:hypothetical protein
MPRALLTLLLLAGALTLSSAPSNADPYPASVATKCTLKVFKKTYATSVGPRARLTVQENDPRKPSGKVHVTFIRKTGKRSTTVRETTRQLRRANRATWRFGKFHQPGKYRMKVTLAPPKSSRFRSCSAAATFRVHR